MHIQRVMKKARVKTLWYLLLKNSCLEEEKKLETTFANSTVSIFGKKKFFTYALK